MFLNNFRFLFSNLGESNVYTIGNIGEHRVVSTKLPLLGKDSRSAKISSGNTTTRYIHIFFFINFAIMP